MLQCMPELSGWASSTKVFKSQMKSAGIKME